MDDFMFCYKHNCPKKNQYVGHGKSIWECPECKKEEQEKSDKFWNKFLERNDNEN